VRSGVLTGLRLLAATAALALALVPAAGAAHETTAPNLFINVHVTLTDSKVIIRPKTAPRGSDARFIVRNIGKKTHTFTVGATRHGAGLQTGFSRSFKPGEHAILIFFLNQRGTIPYYSGPSVGEAKPAMKGLFLVGNQCSLCVQDY
jgi:hypothetical protein